MTARTVFLDDQAQAAGRDAEAILRRVGQELGHQRFYDTPSPWVRDLVGYVIRGRRTCRHLRRATPRVAFLAAHRRRLDCSACAYTANARTLGTLEDRRCDVCRALIPPGQVTTTAVVVGFTIVTIGHCAGPCTDTVRGAGR